MKPIKKEFEFLIENQSGNGTFRLYKDRGVLGQKLFKDLMSKIGGTDLDGKPIEGFYFDDINKKVGFCSQIYGLNGILLMLSSFEVEISDEEKQKIINIIKYILDYIGKNHYDINPYIDNEVNEHLFTNYRYIGSETWALSLFVTLRQLDNSGVLKLDKETSEKVKGHIKFILKDLVDNVIGSEETPLGWGYATGCKEPSLYFTYNVCETYSDVEDFILGNREGTLPDEEMIEYINGGIKEKEEFITERLTKIVSKVGDRTWKLYKEILKNGFVNDVFTENHIEITKNDILNSARSNAAFNILYIINILFFTGTDERNEEEREEIVKSYRYAMQNIFNLYDDLKSLNKESIVDRYVLQFENNHKAGDYFSKELNEYIIQIESLMPVIIKTLSKLAFYVYQYPQQNMTDYFDEILDNKMEGRYLWEKRRYDLFATERYIEAIMAFFDYYDKFEKDYANEVNDRDKIKEELKSEVEFEIERKYQIEFKNKLESELIEKSKEIAENFPIENLINKRIEEKISEKGVQLISRTIEKIIKYNSLPSTRKKEVDFTDDEVQFKSSIEKVILSYFNNSFNDIAGEDNVSELEIKTIDEMKAFVKAFIQFVNKNKSKNDKDKISSTTLFELLESYVKSINQYKNKPENINSKISYSNGFEIFKN